MKQSASDIVIIGGGGFIGRGLRASMAECGYSTIIIGRSHVPDDIRETESFYSIAEHSYESLAALLAVRNIDFVIDLAYATVPNSSFADPVSDFSENLGNVILHLDFARALPGARFVYVSSGGTVYGDLGYDRPYRETDPNFPLSPYGITKMACERYVHMYHRLHGLSTLIVRPSNIYGPGQRPFRGQGLVATALGLAWKQHAVHIYGSGSHIRDYLYIDDFCTGLLAIMQVGTPGEIYNLGYGEGHSILEIIDCIEETIAGDGLRLNRQYNPERPFDVHYSTLDISKVATAMNWQPATTLSEGIRRTWDWIKTYMAEQPAA